MSTYDPFASVIARAEQKAEQKKAEAAEAKLIEDARRATQAENDRATRRLQQMERFEEEFLGCVTSMVVKDHWELPFIRMVQSYSMGLLKQEETVLPKIDSKTCDKILDQFQNVLNLNRYKAVVPEGHFYGETVLLERSDKRNIQKQARINYTRRDVSSQIVFMHDSPVEGTSSSDDEQPSNVVEINSATTPKAKAKTAHGRKVKDPVKAKTEATG